MNVMNQLNNLPVEVLAMLMSSGMDINALMRRLLQGNLGDDEDDDEDDVDDVEGVNM